jgi:hypothetical protein
MSTAQEAPALIQYACERCKTRFVLPPSSRHLGFGGRIKASGMALGRTLRYHEGLGSTYDGARRQLLAKMDDDAYQSFVQSFKFCHECRQFVCAECWSNSRKTCLGCFAKAAGTASSPANRQRPPFAPTGPAIPRPVAEAAPTARRRRLRTDASLLVMGAAALLLIVELVVILPGTLNNNNQPTNSLAANVGTPSPTPSATPSDTATPEPTPSPTASPTPSPTPSATPTDSPTPSPTPTPAPVVTPKPKVTPAPITFQAPVISCKPGAVTVDGTKVTCTWNNWGRRLAGSGYWKLDGSILSSPDPAKTPYMTFSASLGGHSIYLYWTHLGTLYASPAAYVD